MFLHKKAELNQYLLQNTHVPLNYSSETRDKSIIDAQDKALPGESTGATVGAEMMRKRRKGPVFQSDQHRTFLYAMKRPHQKQSELQGNLSSSRSSPNQARRHVFQERLHSAKQKTCFLLLFFFFFSSSDTELAGGVSEV